MPRSDGQPNGLRKQLERAARVQRSLLADVSAPAGEFRLASVYLPCEMLGGDFYDLAWRRDSAVLLVADVMGHGLDAALLTMLVKAAFQETASHTGEPGEILAGMNAHLRRTIPESRLVAAAIASLDLQGCAVRVANAGLPYPFLLHAATRRVEEVPVAGVPLNLTKEWIADGYEVARLQLEPGDVLLLASDGIGSVVSTRGDCFDDRLPGVLEGLAGRDGRSIVDSLAAKAIAYGHGRRLPDDVNLIAVSRDGMPIESRS